MATVQLGQFTDDHADAIAAALEARAIPFYTKRFGRLVRAFSAADWGTRVFVDRAYVVEAVAVARAIAPDGIAKGLRRRTP